LRDQPDRFAKETEGMKTWLILLGIVLAVVVAVLAWQIKRGREPQPPVSIHCSRVITRPQIASSMNSALILAPDGTVWGWGDNGSLMGPRATSRPLGKPARLNVGSNWKTIAAGFNYGVGIKLDGTLWGWSFSSWPSLSNPAHYSNSPTRLAEGSNWLAVASGAGHALALRADGTLWGWGQNDRGQVGTSSTRGNNPLAQPGQIGTNTNWVAIAATSFGSLGLRADGTIWHWGYVHAGYSDGPDINLDEPTPVNDSTNWIGIAGSDYCFIGRQRDGSVWVWGPNAGSLGSPNRKDPFPIPLEGGVAVAEGGNTHLLLLKTNGELWSAGPGQNGASGRPDRAPRGSVERIGDRHDWTAAWSTITTSFGMTSDGTLWTWGTDLGKVGEGSPILRTLFDGLRQLGLPVQQTRRNAPGTSRPWPLAVVVTNGAPSARSP
jgi:alpha-tubulin suppressor-like RCC1 family protein